MTGKSQLSFLNMSHATKENIVKYLASGFKPADVSKVFGISQGYISQVIADPDVKAEIEARLAQASEAAMQIDANYQAIELSATTKIAERLNQGFYKPMELLAVAQVANKAARKFGPSQQDGSSGSATQVITIQLPENLVGISISSTPNNQVVEIGGMSLRQPSKDFIIEQAGKFQEDIEV